MSPSIINPITKGSLFSEIASVYELKSTIKKGSDNEYKSDSFFET